MKNPCKQALIAAAVSLSVAIPQFAFAEATTVTGTGTLNANARVDFQIVIPGVLRFRVGSPAAIDMITFAPTSTNLGTGTIGGTGGDLTGGKVTVDVVANTGDNVNISQTPSGTALIDGAGNSIPYTTIATSSSKAGILDAPALGVAGTTTVLATGNLVQESAEWTYTYANATSYPSGIYGGTAANGGRVTYTASSP